MCNENVDPNEIEKPSKIIRRMIAGLERYCEHRCKGCTWTGPVDLYEGHKASCAFEDIIDADELRKEKDEEISMLRAAVNERDQTIRMLRAGLDDSERRVKVLEKAEAERVDNGTRAASDEAALLAEIKGLEEVVARQGKVMASLQRKVEVYESAFKADTSGNEDDWDNADIRETNRLLRFESLLAAHTPRPRDGRR